MTLDDRPDSVARALSGLRGLVLNDHLLLLLAAGFVLSVFVLELDAYGPLLSLLTLLVIARLIIEPAILAPIPRPLILAVLAFAAIVATGYVTGDPSATTKALSRIGHVAILALVTIILGGSGLLGRFAPWLIGVGVLVHYLAWRVLDMPLGLTSNPHFLAAFAVLTAPALVYWLVYPIGSDAPIAVGRRRSAAIFRPTWQRAAIGLLLLMDLDLLLHTGSTPAHLGTLFALTVVFVLYAGRREQAVGLALFALLALTLWITDYGGAATNLVAKIESVAQEERVQIWSDTLSMFMQNSLPEWLLGHGVGGFRAQFHQISDPRYAAFIFPHNYALEVTYQTGVMGLVAALLLFGWPLWHLARAIGRETGASRRFAGMAILFTFLDWFVLAYLVFPFFTKSTLYTFGILLGVVASYLLGGAAPQRA